MKRKIATLAQYLIVFIPFMLLTAFKKKPILISGYGFFGISMLFFLVMFAYFNARQLDAQRKIYTMVFLALLLFLFAFFKWILHLSVLWSPYILFIVIPTMTGIGVMSVSDHSHWGYLLFTTVILYQITDRRLRLIPARPTFLSLPTLLGVAIVVYLFGLLVGSVMKKI